MKLVLDAQQDFINKSAANEPSFAVAKTGGEFQLNFKFGDFVTKLREIGASFKNNVSDGPLSKAVAGQFDAQDTNFLSGILEGLGLDNVAKDYIDNRRENREKEEFVQKFMNENPATEILTPETARAAAEEEFRMMRDGTKPEPVSLTETMDKETVLEQATITQKQVELDGRMTSDIADIKENAEQQLPIVKELQSIAEQMLLQLQIIAANGIGGGGLLGIPDFGGKNPKPGPGGKKGIGSRIAAGAKGLLGGVSGVAGKLAIPITLGMGGYEVFKNEQAVDAGTMSREDATKQNTQIGVGTATGIGAATLVAGKATLLAAPLGPAAPVVGLLAGAAAFFLGDKLGRTVTESVQENVGTTDISGGTEMMDPEQMIFAAPLESPVTMQSTANQLEKQTGGGSMEIQQTTQNNVSSPTTVINNNSNTMKTPRNDEPTFDRYTQQRAYP